MNLSLVFLCTIFGAILAFLLHTPVPDGLHQPWKYRLLVATLSFNRLMARIDAYFHPENKFAYIQTMRYMRSLINTPSPSKVPGSNIRSKVKTFDGVRVRLYQPIIKKSEGLRPALIYIHGGGYALGSADTYDRLVRDIAERLENMVVVSIDYSLAPENPFPAGYTDCVRATTWLLRHADEYGVDATRIGIAGDSGGGHFSAAVAQAIHDDPSVSDLQLQVLIYPALQTLDFLTPALQMYDQKFGDEGILPRKAIAAFNSMHLMGRVDPGYMKQILANEHLTDSFRNNSPYMDYISHDLIPEEIRRETTDLVSPRQLTDPGNETLWASLKPTYLDPRWAPLMRKRLKGLPHAFIATCGFDSIRDDGIFYAKRLKAAGVKTKWKHYESGFHGVFFLLNLYWFDTGEEMKQDALNFVRKHI